MKTGMIKTAAIKPAIKFSIFILILISILIVDTCTAQEARFTQVMANPLRLNPALMGPNTDLKLSGNYRNQWAILGKGYESAGFSGLLPIFVSNGMGKLDIGMSVLNNSAGAFKSLDAAMAIGYTLQLNSNNNLSVSLMSGYVQNTLNASRLSFDAQYIHGNYNSSNPSLEPTLNPNINYADLSFGMLWFYNPDRYDGMISSYLGFSGFHMNQPHTSMLNNPKSNLPAKYSVQAGIKILGDNGFDVCPEAQAYYMAGSVSTAVGLHIDAFLSDQLKFVAGSWYRNREAIAVMLGIEHNRIALGYSYDITCQPLNAYFNGLNTNEFTLSFKFSRLSRCKMESFGGEGSSPSVKNNLLNSF